MTGFDEIELPLPTATELITLMCIIHVLINWWMVQYVMLNFRKHKNISTFPNTEMAHLVEVLLCLLVLHTQCHGCWCLQGVRASASMVLTYCILPLRSILPSRSTPINDSHIFVPCQWSRGGGENMGMGLSIHPSVRMSTHSDVRLAVRLSHFCAFLKKQY